MIENKEWAKNAEKNAEHRAAIFIDSGNYQKAAEALKEIPYKKSLEFLYDLGRNFLHHHDTRSFTVVKTSELIKKGN